MSESSSPSSSPSSHPLSALSFDRFWSYNQGARQKSPCLLVMTLLMGAALLAMLVYMLVGCFSKDNASSKEETSYEFAPPLELMTTVQAAAAPDTVPSFMMAVSVLNNNNNCSINQSISITAFYSVASLSANSTLTVAEAPLNLEACTDQHFSLLPGKLQKLAQWTRNSLQCLPLNQNLPLGGSTSNGGAEKYLSFKFTCPSACGMTTNCGTVEFFTQNAQVNADNADSVYSYYLDRRSFIVSNPTTYENVYELDFSSVETDEAVLFSDVKVSSSLAGGRFHEDVPTSNSSTTALQLKHSDKLIRHTRSYVRLFDVFTYIGGLAQFLFILFFFLASFGTMLFEMHIAEQLFRSKEAKEINFGSFLKQKLYNAVTALCCQPDWEPEKKRKELKQAVRTMNDTVLLQKRIAFLEEAISVLLEKHQLKGIYLVHNLTEVEAQRCQQSHKFRDRVVYYLNKYNKDKKAGRGRDDYGDAGSRRKEQELKGSSSSSDKYPSINKKIESNVGSSQAMMSS
jgi:hypothetical protein